MTLPTYMSSDHRSHRPAQSHIIWRLFHIPPKFQTQKVMERYI